LKKTVGMTTSKESKERKDLEKTARFETVVVRTGGESNDPWERMGKV